MLAMAKPAMAWNKVFIKGERMRSQQSWQGAHLRHRACGINPVACVVHRAVFPCFSIPFFLINQYTYSRTQLTDAHATLPVVDG